MSAGIARAVIVFLLLLSASFSCKSKSKSTTRETTPAAVASAPEPASAPPPAAPLDAGSDSAVDADGKRFYIDTVAVSSRVDNDTERPEALIDGDTSTAWSSATGDLEGAWVAFAITGPTTNVFRAVHLTVGMTKDPALFGQNPRIAEVAISWGAYPVTAPKRTPPREEKVIVERAKLDPDSPKLQRIPIDVRGVGDLRITIKKVKLGTRSDWREVTISEVVLEDDEGHLMPGTALETSVGDFDQKPRGKLGISPEAAVTLKCFAADGARAICAVGRRLESAVLVAIDKNGGTKLADLPRGPLDITEHRMPWPAWRRVEKSLGPATHPLVESDKAWLGWKATNTLANGCTFRTSETKRGPLPKADAGETMNGIVEVQFPGTEIFVPVLPEFVEDVTFVKTLLSTLDERTVLVERSVLYKGPGRYSPGLDVAICDLPSRTCTSFAAPP